MDIETVSNTRYGIVIKDGNKYTPTVTFIHPSRNEWLNLIPKDSKDYIDSDKSILKSKLSYLSATNATFINYPFTSFFHLNMSVEYIVAMSQNGSYDIMSNSKLFEI
jgi:outer membrane protein W